MSITYNTAAANARLAAGLTATGVPGQSVDGNTGVGILVIGTAGMAAVLASVPLQKPSFTLANKVATLAGVPLSALATGGGLAASAQITDSAGAVIISGLTVGTSGTDIIIGGTASLVVNETFSLSFGSITTQ